MAQVLVRGLPEDVVARLRRLAEHADRSLEAHLRVILTEASRLDRSAFIALADRIAAGRP
jgi:plasmid stability protein